jgi:hypothetical protein
MLRSLALVALLAGSTFANINLRKGGGNYVRVENGQIVEYDFAQTLQSPQGRNGDGSTGDDNVFNGSISIIDALNPNSPFSQWIDDLLNPDSDPYVQAVVNALKILLAIMLSALAPLGINNFTILILGFAPGSVTVNYELAIDQNEFLAAGEPGDSTLLSNIYNVIDNNGDIIEGVEINNQKTSLSGGDGTTIESECPACWTVSNGFCVPDPNFLTLTCDASGMSLAVDYCVMGNVGIEDLTMNGQCDQSTSNIVDNGSRFVATTALDGCSSGMTFDSDNVTFSNWLTNFDSGDIINTGERYKVDFNCKYGTTYDVSDTTEVEANIINGPTGGVGELTFTLDTYTDNTFSTLDASGIVRVGTTLYFGISISSPINNVEFATTDCTVYSDADYSAADTLEYGILTGQCPNSHVNFISFDSTSATTTTHAYTVFEFKNSDSTTLHLSCNVVVCDAEASGTTCKATPSCSRRKRRSLEEGVQYYRVNADLVIQ